ncbi:uncharacterized protein LOC123315851 [Coccinella septempunctata]|uniref:uncharacterized protein LOC123315851 n=1 Tax=Coccinella septempunctata TaxID=41139 RepID=UPI001D0944FC|nr:uncharacterized protein LOC123315851 [Coccinella septempunctata]
MFWDDWESRDIQVYGIFVALGIFFLWNTILTINLISLRRKCISVNTASGDITTTRIATSPVWNQIYVPKIPRLQKVKSSNPTSISSIPQTPSDWFGDGPAQMDNNIFF